MKHVALLLLLAFASSVPGAASGPAKCSPGHELRWQAEDAGRASAALILGRRIPGSAAASAVRALARLLRQYAEGHPAAVQPAPAVAAAC